MSQNSPRYCEKDETLFATGFKCSGKERSRKNSSQETCHITGYSHIRVEFEVSHFVLNFEERFHAALFLFSAHFDKSYLWQ